MGAQHKQKNPGKSTSLHVFVADSRDSPSILMSRSPSTNQTPLRRSRRNRRNRQQPETPPNQRPPRVQRINFSPKLKYRNSFRNNEGVLILSKRKRPLPTPQEIAAKKQKKFEIKCRRQSVIALSHEVVALWKHGMNTEELKFEAKQAKKIVAYLQANYPQYAKKSAASSFVYRALKRDEKAAEDPHLEPHRDRRSEHKGCPKRKNDAIIVLCDELLSMKKATAPKVQSGLRRNGFSVSLSTIYRIAKDLTFKWTKPWHTDVLTPAQKFKRKFFTAKLLRMSPEQMLRLIATWMFSDEKWWDIVGPACYEYIKAATKIAAKMQNQVCNVLLVFFFILLILFCSSLFIA